MAKKKIIIKLLSTKSMFFYTIYKKKNKSKDKTNKTLKLRKFDPVKNVNTWFQESKI